VWATTSNIIIKVAQTGIERMVVKTPYKTDNVYYLRISMKYVSEKDSCLQCNCLDMMFVCVYITSLTIKNHYMYSCECPK
jgi:hypothetical protein